MSKVDLDRFTDFMVEYKKEIVKDYEEEIERLKEEYIMLQNASDEVEEEKDKEIERLKEENTILKQTMSNNSLLINENAFLKERISKAIEYIYHWSTQRKIFFDKIDRHLNGKPRFYGDIADLLNILEGEDNE